MASSPGIKAGKLKKNAHGFTLALQLERLPFFVEPAARKVLPFLPFQETFNELMFNVRNLTSEFGYFRSESMRSASLSRADFDAGLNLFSQWSIPSLKQAEAVHRFTLEKDQIFYRAWRLLGLNGVNSSYYNAKAHMAGIRMSQAVEACRSSLLKGRAAQSFTLNVVATDLPGEVIGSGDYVSQWSMQGPFPTPFDTDTLNGEAAFTAQVPKLSSGWRACDLDLVNPGNNLTQALGVQTNCFAYAVTLIRSPVAQEAELLAGSDDGVAIWLNGETLLKNLDVTRGVTPDQERVKVQLRAGDNVLLLKVSQDLGGWGMCVRFAGLQQSVIAIRP